MQPRAIQRLAEAAQETWREVADRVAASQPADTALAAWWRRHPHYGARDRRFIGETVFSAFRWKGWLDQLPGPDPRHLGLAYLLDATAPHPAATLLAPEVEGHPPAGGRNLVEKADWLRNVAGSDRDFRPGDLIPDWVEPVLPAGQLNTFINGIQGRPPLGLRCRPGTATAVLARLAKGGFTGRPHPALPDALIVDKAPPSGLLHELERLGCTPHDLHSQCVVPAGQPQPGQSWWDVCAGAGGKTLHLADLLQGRGRLLATDIREDALRELERRAATRGTRHLELRLLRPDADPPGAPFDGILLDAPCSGLGTWGRNPDARWRTTPETVQRAAATQTTLLQRATRYLKPGGRLVYATCSITRTEGAEVFHHALASLPLQPLPVQLPLHNTPASEHTLWPDTSSGIGMYIACAKLL